MQKPFFCLLIAGLIFLNSMPIYAANLDDIGSFEEINEQKEITDEQYLAKIEQLKARSQDALTFANQQCELYPEDPGLQEAKAFIESEISFIETASNQMQQETKNKVWAYDGFYYPNEKILEVIAGLEAEAERSFHQIVKTDLSADYFYGYVGLDEERKAIVNCALSMEGKIPYVWGAKPTDNTADSVIAQGLDCSGFIEWVYWNVTGEKNEDVASTYNITHNLEEISYEELKPGDIATIYPDGSCYTDENGVVFYNEQQAATEGTGEITIHTNHTGIYVGKDENGLDLFVHCRSGKDKTVVITTEEEFSSFAHYYRVTKK